MGTSNLNMKQGVGYAVIKSPAANVRDQYLNLPVICEKCKNMRRWKIRCEYCGFMLRIEENAK